MKNSTKWFWVLFPSSLTTYVVSIVGIFMFHTEPQKSLPLGGIALLSVMIIIGSLANRGEL